VFKSLILISKPVQAAGIFGQIKPPPGVDKYSGGQGAGLVKLLNNILRLLIVGAGLFALFNFIIAGYEFITAGGDAQKINQAWAKIWQSLLGLVVAAGSFTLAAVFGKLIFGRWDAILTPTIYAPY